MKVIYNNKEVANTTLNYNELFNKPLLNSHELVGNTSLNDIGVYSKPQVDNLIASTRSIKVVSALPTPLVANTMYYVGPDANNLYHIYLVDSSLTLIDLGMSQDAVYLGGNGIDISSDNEISVVFDNETLMLNSEGELYVRSATQNVEGVVSYDNVSIKKNSSGKIYVPTTKSGDRFDNYPYTNTIGYTDVGKAINFYGEDTSTSGNNTLVSVTNPAAGQGNVGDFYVNNTSDSSRSGTVVTSGILDGSTVKYDTSTKKVTVPISKSGDHWGVFPYTDGGGITAVGQAIDFYTSDTTTSGGSARLQFYPNSHKLVLGDYSQSPANVTTIPSGPSTVGSVIQPVYVNDGIITKTQSLFTVDGATNIPANSNLNTTAFTACGKYSCGSSANAGTLTNCPSTSGFTMIVENVVGPDAVSLSNVGGWVSRTRIIESYYGDKWVQSIVKGGASDTTITYGAWRRVLDSGAVSLRHLTDVTRNTTYISEGVVDFWVDHATCVASGFFRLSQDVPAQTVLYTLPSGYTIADNTYGFIFGSAGGFKLAKARYNQATIIADSAITANSSETKYINVTFMLSKYPE